MAIAVEPQIVAGYRMPSHQTIIQNDATARAAAEFGSSRLLAALLRYGASHGLPLIDADECRRRLEALP